MVDAQTYHSPAKRRTTALALLMAAVAGWWWWRPFRVAVQGHSMRPTFGSGDWLLATRRGRVRAGSIVVIEHPERPGFELIKRVAGSRDGGTPRVLTELWVVGDNPRASTDSRTFGPVRRDAVRGVVRFRYRSSPRHYGW